MPDLLLRWDGREELESRSQLESRPQLQSRPLFVRASVCDAAFRRDIDVLSDQHPVFLGALDVNRDEVSSGDPLGSLVTPSSAVDQLEEALASESRTNQATSPLVREGEGYLGPEAAGDLGRSFVEALKAMEQASDPTTFDINAVAESVQRALKGFESYLRGKASMEIEQGLQSQWIQEGLEPERFPGRTEWDVRTMSKRELGRLLAALLLSQRPVSPQTWVRNANHLSIEELGAVIGKPFFNGRFDELAREVMYGWVAQWAWIELLPGLPLESQFAWLTDGRFVGLQANDIKVWFAGDGRHFANKEGGLPLPSLEAGSRWLDDPAVTGVSLSTSFDDVHYMRRSGAVSVLKRVHELTDITGGYFIQALKAVAPGQDCTADVQFERGLISTETATPVRVLAQMAYRYFSRNPSGIEGLDAFLRREL